MQDDYTIAVTIHKSISASFGFVVTDMENIKSMPAFLKHCPIIVSL